MYSCSQVTRWISSDDDQRAGLVKRLGIGLHLVMCEDCSRYRDQLKALSQAAREAAKKEAPASEVAATGHRIINKLKEKP